MGSSNIEIKEAWKVEEDKYECPKCDKIYSKKGICSHIWYNHTEEGQKLSSDRSENISQERFETDDFEGSCEYCGRNFVDQRRLGAHIIHCDKNPERGDIYKRISESQSGKEFTEEHKG